MLKEYHRSEGDISCAYKNNYQIIEVLESHKHILSKIWNKHEEYVVVVIVFPQSMITQLSKTTPIVVVIDH